MKHGRLTVTALALALASFGAAATQSQEVRTNPLVPRVSGSCQPAVVRARHSDGTADYRVVHATVPRGCTAAYVQLRSGAGQDAPGVTLVALVRVTPGAAVVLHAGRAGGYPSWITVGGWVVAIAGAGEQYATVPGAGDAVRRDGATAYDPTVVERARVTTIPYVSGGSVSVMWVPGP